MRCVSADRSLLLMLKRVCRCTRDAYYRIERDTFLHDYDASSRGIEYFTKLDPTLVSYDEIPRDFLFFPMFPTVILLNKCVGLLNLRHLPDTLRKLVIIDTEFDVLDLTHLDKLEHLEINTYVRPNSGNVKWPISHTHLKHLCVKWSARKDVSPSIFTYNSLKTLILSVSGSYSIRKGALPNLEHVNLEGNVSSFISPKHRHLKTAELFLEYGENLKERYQSLVSIPSLRFLRVTAITRMGKQRSLELRR